MDQNAVILGLSRHTKLMGLPLPYAMGVLFLTMLPFIWFKILLWLLTAPIWYGVARLVTKINPNAHILMNVLVNKTLSRLLYPAKEKPYV